MQKFEYKVVPAPKKGEKVRGARTTQERFAHTLTEMMNDLGRDGWEYLRADTLPCEERVGLTGRTTVFQNMLVFRRATAPVAVAQPAMPEAPAARPLVARIPERAADRVMADYAALTARRKLMAEAPAGDAPRITLVPSAQDPVTTAGSAPGNGVGAS